MLEAPPDASKSVPLTHSVVVLIPYFSIISKSQSTGVNIKQLSNPPSSFTGMVRFFCLSSVRLGPRSTIQSVLQLCGKLMPTNTWPITSKARNMLGMHNATTKRFWNKPNELISFKISPKLLIFTSKSSELHVKMRKDLVQPQVINVTWLMFKLIITVLLRPPNCTLPNVIH